MKDIDQTRSLEERVAQLENTPRQIDHEMTAQLALVSQKIDQLFELLRSQKEWLEAETALSREARRQTILLAKAYYDIFPERYLRDNADSGEVLDRAGDEPDAR